MNWQETKQLANKHKNKIKRAKWLVKHEGYTHKRAAETTGVTVKEIERVNK